MHYLRFGKDLDSMDEHCRNKCSIYVEMMASQFPSVKKQGTEIIAVSSAS